MESGGLGRRRYSPRSERKDLQRTFLQTQGQIWCYPVTMHCHSQEIGSVSPWWVKPRPRPSRGCPPLRPSRRAAKRLCLWVSMGRQKSPNDFTLKHKMGAKDPPGSLPTNALILIRPKSPWGQDDCLGDSHSQAWLQQCHTMGRGRVTLTCAIKGVRRGTMQQIHWRWERMVERDIFLSTGKHTRQGEKCSEVTFTVLYINWWMCSHWPSLYNSPTALEGESNTDA